MNHLLYEGVNVDSAQNDAYNWALYNTDDTMQIIRSAEEKCRVKYELREQKQFGGATLCKKLKDANTASVVIYRESQERK